MEKIEVLKSNGINARGYQNAIQYYDSLKKKLIKTTVDEIKRSGQINNLYYDINNEITSGLMTTIDSSDSTKAADEMLQYAQMFVNDVLTDAIVQDRVQTIINDIKKRKISSKAKTSNANKLYLQRIKRRQQQILSTIPIQTFFKTMNVADDSSIAAQLKSYMVRYIVQQL